MNQDVAVVVVAAWGDVLISSALVRAIKEQWKSKITYYTSSVCRSAIDNNPDVDELVVIPVTCKDHAWGIQGGVIEQARSNHPMVFTAWAGHKPQHEWTRADRESGQNFMYATARYGVEAGLKMPDPLKLYLHTTPSEKKRAAGFIYSIAPKQHTVMMEIEGHSSQSNMNQSWLMPIVDTVIAIFGGDVNVLLSRGGEKTHEIMAVESAFSGRFHVLNNYSLREVSVIFNSCDVFIGCSSGTSNACHGHECRTNVRWFESVKNTLWDSTPLRLSGKFISYDAGLEEFLDLLRGYLK